MIYDKENGTLKNSRMFFLIIAVSFIITLSLLTVDRKGAYMYHAEDTISERLQVFIEKLIDLH